MLYKTFAFKAADVEGLGQDEFAGYASVFRVVDDYGDMVLPGAFTKTLPAFLEDGFIGNINHDWDNPIGSPVDAYEDEKGLFLRAKVSDTQAGRDCLTLMRDKVVKKLSIGFRTQAYAKLSEEQAVAILGQQGYEDAVAALPYWADGIRALTQLKLYEASPVTVPANGQADILGVKGMLPAGLPYPHHSEAVRAAVKGFSARTRELLDLRQKDGRSLSDEHRQQVLARADELEGALAEVRSLAVAVKGRSAADDTLALRSQFQAARARLQLLGV